MPIEALTFVHRMYGLVHRDIKPDNILIGQERSYLLDFGIARRIGDSERDLTATGAVLGTVAYLAPEQLRNAREVDFRADVFALGVILFELTTGLRPSAGLNAMGMVTARMTMTEPFDPSRYAERASLTECMQQ